MQLNLDEALYSTLYQDYQTHKENHHYQSQLQAGFDYIEAVVKLFGVLSISIIKEMDEELYKKILINNFKLAPSLGHFIALIREPYSKGSKQFVKELKVNPLYTLLDEALTKNINMQLVNPQNILEGGAQTNNISSPMHLINDYIGTFRNKLKGHAASFKDEDKAQRDVVLENLDSAITQLKTTYDEIVNALVFTYDDLNNNILVTYQDTTITLLPIVSYITCDKYSCNEHPRSKLFFYNDGKETKSHYLDYSYNHYYQVTQKNEIHERMKVLQEAVLHSTSDLQRQSHLLANFVGREEELKQAKEHILRAITNNQASFFSVMGGPGIGKSAFLTKLQYIIAEDEIIKDTINSYTFYAQKGQMDTEEDKYLWKKLSEYFNQHNISIKQEGEFVLRNNLEALFRAYEDVKDTKPLLLIIDGLDEFSNPSEILQKIPLNFQSKIHLIYASRPYANIKNTIASNLSGNEHLAIQNKENILKEGQSFELGALLDGEVEELLSHVLSKDISRESEAYQTIVQTIAKQSKRVPLYIHYITQELKEKGNHTCSNITEDIIRWAKSLPPKLDSFYLDRFKNVDSLSRKILTMLFFSHTAVSKEEFYTVLRAAVPEEFKTEEGRTIDEIMFIEKYFNDIEMFLTINSNNKYSFYHLSVKEQLREYFKEIKQAFSFNTEKLTAVLFKSQVNHYKNTIEEILYFKKNSDLYNLLQQLIQVVNTEDTPSYYSYNYFHLLNTLKWANIYISQLNHEDMENEQYEALLEQTELKAKNLEEIQDFFKGFDAKEKKHRFEIRYAYDLAFIAKDYKKVLEYKDSYEDYINQLFLEIVHNIDKPEYIQKFLQYKEDWKNSLNDFIRDFLVVIINKQEVLDDLFHVIPFMEARLQVVLVSKLSSQKALALVEMIEDNRHKLDALINIVDKIDEEELLDKALDIFYRISDEVANSAALISIVSKISETNIDKALDIVNRITYDEDKAKALVDIVSHVVKTNIDKALDIVNSISSVNWESKALVLIASKISETNIDKALDIVNRIPYDEDKAKALVLIASKISETNIDRALHIAKSMSDRNKLNILEAITDFTNDTETINKILGMTEKIFKVLNSRQAYRMNDANILVTIASKVDEGVLYKVLQQARPFFFPKIFKAMINNIKDLKKALQILKKFFDEYYLKSYILEDIIENSKDIDKGLQLLEYIPDVMIKSLVLQGVALKIDNLEKVLEISELMPNDWNYNESILFKIIRGTNNTELLNKVMNRVERLSSGRQKYNLLYEVISKTNDKKLLIKVLDSVIGDSSLQLKINTLIIAKTNDNELITKASEITSPSFLRKSIPSLSDFLSLDTHSAIVQAIAMPLRARKLALLAIVIYTNELDMILELAISFPEIQLDALMSLVDKYQDTDILDKLLPTLETIPDDNKVKISKYIIDKFDNVDILENVQKIIQSIENDDEKYALLVLIAPKLNVNNAIKIIESTPVKYINEDTITLITPKVNEDDSLQQIIKVTEKLSYRCKLLALPVIAEKANDDITLNKIFKIANDLGNLGKLKIPKNKNNLFFQKLFNSENRVNQTNLMLAKLSPDIVLKYYGIATEGSGNNVQVSDLENIILKLEELINADFDKKEKRTLFNIIKRQILDNESLLNEFISKFGDKLEIDDKESFDDEFSLKTYEKNIELLKGKN